MTDARTEARWDSQRDHRKNNDGPLPLDAHSIALLARARTTSFDEAVSVIQQFANTVAAEARVEAYKQAGTEILAAFDGVVPT